MSLQRIYEVVIDEWGDPRAKKIVWVNTPLTAILSTVCYWYFIRVCGPKFMKNRPGYDLKIWISLYNITQVIWNMYLMYTGLQFAFGAFNMETWLCVPLITGNEYLDNLTMTGSTLYFYNKIFDFMDTIFFVLRKKYSQVSYLHVYHHITMVFASWVFAKYHPGGNAVSGGIFNALVHIVMYSYYQLSLLKWGNSEKWKKHITQLQIFQLITVGCHNGILFFRNPCKASLFISAICVIQSVYLSTLFIRFYYHTYWKKSKKN